MLVDHQTGTLGWVKSPPVETMATACHVLARMAVAYDMPPVLTTTMEQQVGLTISDIVDLAPAAFAARAPLRLCALASLVCATYNLRMAASPVRDLHPRATRDAGRETRSRLLDAAAAAFREGGLAGVSLAAVATAAGAFPSQVTYYFGSKEALFVEAACRELLHLGARAEAAASTATAPRGYVAALVRTVAPDPALGLVIEALGLGRRRADLRDALARTFERLHVEGARAFTAVRAARGWSEAGDARAEAERFWALALGVSLRRGGGGPDAHDAAEEMLRVMDMAPLAKDTDR